MATGATQTLLLKEIFRAISLTNVIPRRLKRKVLARVMKAVLKILNNALITQFARLVTQALAAQFAIRRQISMLWAHQSVASVTLQKLYF